MNQQNQFNPDDIDAELEEELRQIFAVDSREYLQSYIDNAQDLTEDSWKENIQEMYRSIHTIKGSAVTVGADAILQVSIALEDLLSELRYQEPPFLEDGKLRNLLLEVGELTVSSLEIIVKGDEAKKAVEPSIKRIEALKTEIEKIYLPDWNEQTLIQQEFAEQGFDLVILDLEMAVEELNADEAQNIDEEKKTIANNTLTQLVQIGKDLQLGEGWDNLINKGFTLIQTNDSQQWSKEFPSFFIQLKESAKKGGILIDKSPNKPSQTELKPTIEISPDHISDNESIFDQLDDIDINIEYDSKINEINELDKDTVKLENFDDLSSILELKDLEVEDVFDFEEIENNEQKIKIPDSKVEAPKPKEKNTDTNIPIPLTRIQKTSEDLVEVLLSNRTAISYYQNLQLQVSRIVNLAQDTNQYITRLRQIQNDYSLLENNPIQSKNDLNVERYRQGYTTINHLLENSLRLSEVGAEASKISNNVQTSLQHLEFNLFKLQQSIDSSRLISFKNLAFRARAIIRDLSNRYNKPIKLIIEGEDIDLDVGVNTKLEPILLHLLRNAFDHGIESTDERLQRDKNDEGIIKVSLARIGNQYILSIEDDGNGIDSQIISTIAKRQKLPLTSTDTSAQLLEVLCQPGFSSKDSISDVSGRGVGMDVVNQEIKRLKGNLTLKTQKGKGTTFNILIPVPNLFVPCITIKAGDRTFAIPKEEVISTSLLSEVSIEVSENNYAGFVIKTERNELPAMMISDYWNENISSTMTSVLQNISDIAICICVGKNHNQPKIWLIADDLQSYNDLLLEPLPAPLIAPVGLLGLSLNTDGSLIPVISGIAIADYILNQTKTNISPDILATEKSTEDDKDNQNDPENNTILVVDDAALMRRRLEASLTAYGYDIHTSEDGQEAWNWLQQNPFPRLIITDIEMPNMDGFTLIDFCRQAGMTLPILVVSSRLSEDWAKEAKRLGATDYLTKGFSTAQLISKINQLINN